MAAQQSGPVTTSGGDENKRPFIVYPWYFCTQSEIGPYWVGALMSMGIAYTLLGAILCEHYPFWCITSAAVGLVCSLLAQKRIYHSSNISQVRRKIHQCLQDPIIQQTDDLSWFVEKLKEEVNSCNDDGNDIEKQTKRLWNIVNQQEISGLDFWANADKLGLWRIEIKTCFDEIMRSIEDMYGLDDRLKSELNVFTTNIKKLKESEEVLAQELALLGETYGKLKFSKESLSDELIAFKRMRAMIKNCGLSWTKDIVSMIGLMKAKYDAIQTLGMTLSINHLKEIVHNIEYMDGRSGWTRHKFKELLRRLPSYIKAKANLEDIRHIFEKELLKAETETEESVLPGRSFVCFEVFQKEIVQNCLLPLCDALGSTSHGTVRSSENEVSSYLQMSSQMDL